MAALAIVLIGGAVVYYGRGNRAPLSQREVATQVLAEYIRKTASPKSVVVISNPLAPQAGMTSDMSTFEKAGVAGLRKGFGSAVDLTVALPKTKGEPGSVFYDPNTRTPMSFLITDNAFEEIARENPNADVFVSLIGLPANPASMMAIPKRFAFLLPDFRLMGDASSIRHVFKSGKVIAAVIQRPGVTAPEKVAGSDYKREFEKRYILVTTQNVDEWLPALLR
ncbi:MAG TPA: hypothetical protein VM680_04915 [Verrucomicrobiae bacterium]|nr:hypothetical protein [Verrucomicrobiae bacterium]